MWSMCTMITPRPSFEYAPRPMRAKWLLSEGRGRLPTLPPHATEHSPSAATAKHFGVSRTTAPNWIYRARRMGLLGPATWGRTGDFSIRRALTSR